MPQPPLRIAVLECGSPPPNTNAKYGGYGGVFASLLNSGAQALLPTHPDLPLSITAYDVVDAQAYPDLEEIDAALITGSKHNSFDDDEWILKLVEFTKIILAQERVRLIGVCFGHQIIGRAMGVKVGRNEKGWEASVTDVELTERGKEIFGKGTLSLNQMHRDVVFEYPKGVEELAFTDKCAVQGMYLKKSFIAVQGHPEFNEEIVKELLRARHASGIFDDALFEDAWSRAGNEQDGVVVAKAFLKFLLD